MMILMLRWQWWGWRYFFRRNGTTCGCYNTSIGPCVIRFLHFGGGTIGYQRWMDGDHHGVGQIILHVDQKEVKP